MVRELLNESVAALETAQFSCMQGAADFQANGVQWSHYAPHRSDLDTACSAKIQLSRPNPGDCGSLLYETTAGQSRLFFMTNAQVRRFGFSNLLDIMDIPTPSW